MAQSPTHVRIAGPGGFNEASRKTCKNLEAAITASKRPGYFAYYEQPDHLTAVVRSGEVERLQAQAVQLQKQIDQLSDKIEALHSAATANTASSSPSSGGGSPTFGAAAPNVHNLKQWFATYGAPKQADTSADAYTNFTPNKKVYGGTTHYSAFRSQSSTMKKGRLTR